MATHFVVDVETDGAVPGPYSMVAIGAVALTPQKSNDKVRLEEVSGYYAGPMQPISDRFEPETLAISGFSRADQLSGKHPAIVIPEFDKWVRNHARGKAVFWSNNLAFDWQWINYYFHAYLQANPFGYSGRRIGDVFAGLHSNLGYEWKRHRTTMHDHNPLNDARGNGEALKLLSETVGGW